MDIISGVVGALKIREKVAQYFKKKRTVEVIPKAEKTGKTPDKMLLHFVVNIINNDSINLEIVSIGYTLNKREEKNFVERFALPMTLTPYRSKRFVFYTEETLSDRPKKIWIIDHRDRTYYSSPLKTKKALKQLVKSYKLG